MRLLRWCMAGVLFALFLAGPGLSGPLTPNPVFIGAAPATAEPNPPLWDFSARSTFAVGVNRDFRVAGVTETEAWTAGAYFAYSVLQPSAEHPAAPRLALVAKAEQPFDSDAPTRVSVGVRWTLKRAGGR